MNKAADKSLGIAVPIVALTLYSVASGYLMSLIPLVTNQYQLPVSLVSWLASVFYAGLLVGSLFFEPIVQRIGHKLAFITCLVTFIASIVILPMLPSSTVWLIARFIAGIAVAGVFVVVESWLLDGDERSRAKRLSFYMISLYGGTAFGQMGITLLGTEGLLPFAIICVTLSLAILTLLCFKTAQPNSTESESLSFKQIINLDHAAIIGCIVSGLTLGAIYGLMPLELANRHIAHGEIGTLMALIILGGMVVQPTVTLLSKWTGKTLLMAFYGLAGVFAIGLTLLTTSTLVLAIALFVLGMAVFALYPVAITLGCQQLDNRFIVSATQVMLFSYSVGSVVGPALAGHFMLRPHGLLGYLFAILVPTTIYMLFAAMKTRKVVSLGE
ncbi:MFS transporter [Vibrio sp. IRLE0018]|uniref:MFS transporter n=1 Tax=Vibrio TaxID=662 RepID=UPI001593A711|nr:MFS transporter [Vibrio floridensis]NVC64195.1 MFS transporter [Vibrio sp. 05-20-BW147]HAS6347092.1 MFS transporter [Vibrio vulnificus]